VTDVVTPGTGLLAARGDHEGIAQALTELAADRDRRLEMGARGRAHVGARYRHESLLERMTELYERLLAERA
jgi:glycosyltransferase involved in cell wall biosynthesis